MSQFGPSPTHIAPFEAGALSESILIEGVLRSSLQGMHPDARVPLDAAVAQRRPGLGHVNYMPCFEPEPSIVRLLAAFDKYARRFVLTPDEPARWLVALVQDLHEDEFAALVAASTD